MSLTTRPLSALAACKSLCYFANWEISNLKVHKLLFLAQVFYTRKYGDKLIDDSFEAWVYGPVLPILQRKLARFGSRNISDIFWRHRVTEDAQHKDVLEAFATISKNFTPGELLGITHKPGGAWDRYWRPEVKGTVIPHKYIEAEYNVIFGQAGCSASCHELTGGAKNSLLRILVTWGWIKIYFNKPCSAAKGFFNGAVSNAKHKEPFTKGAKNSWKLI